jgi:general L-amino acid transport system permease protein
VQGALLAVLVVVGLALWRNTAENLAARGIRSGFAFLHEPAGFDIGEGPLEYAPTDSYLHAFAAGLANTLRVAALGIVLATVLGTLVGVGRLSRNLLVRWLSTGYVEVLRNVPLLIQLLAWYLVLTELLPDAAEPLALAPHVYLSKGGLQLPHPAWAPGWAYALGALPAGVIAAWALLRWARARRALTGHAPHVAGPAAAIVVAAPALGWLAGGAPRALAVPEVGPFNVAGGLSLTPEFLALLVGLSTYTAASIAELVRSGILAVSQGQTEAALALGLSRRQVLRKVLLPQAARVIVPPLTNQYLNLTKNSSLAVAIGYPDVVSIANTSINQNGQALEAILLIMAVYLTVNLLTALGMSWYNRRVALVER